MGLSNFPTSLDSITNKTDNADDVLAAHINLCNDAIEAIEAKLGIDSSAVVTSIEYLLKNASSHNVGHTHSLTTGANDVTATAAELNIMDGVTATTAELNILDGADTNLTTFTLPASTTISAFGRTVVDDANAAAVRTTIGCPTDPAAGTAGLRTLGTTSVKACAGNDSRLSDTRTPPNASVSQAKLKTSMGSINVTATGANTETATDLILPGGEHGFWPQTKATRSDIHTMISESQVLNAATFAAPFSTSYRSNMWLRVKNGPNGQTVYTYAQQRYVTASGEVHWVFILRTKFDEELQEKDVDGNPMTSIRPKGTIISIYQAPDHPCFGNGGKSLLVSHPFGNYDETKHEIIVINPSLEEIEQMELETIVDDETKPDKDLLEVIAENYEIDEDSSPAWPDIPVTVGFPKHVKDKKTGKKILADYRFMSPDTIIEPIKKKIPKPDYIKVKSLKRK